MTGKLVWITEAEARRRKGLYVKWLNAPADPAAQVLYAIAHNIDGDTPIESARDAVLRALAVPQASA